MLDIKLLIKKLASEHSLSLAEYKALVEGYNEENAALIAEYAVNARKSVYSNSVYIRGLIEISNICKNNCLYCGIRRDNRDCERYRLTKEDILSCCDEGYALGFRTFVMQGGEDEGEPGTVCMVLQKGYKLGNRVIRHAMVKVVAG